jgi:hypothetical protein
VTGNPVESSPHGRFEERICFAHKQRHAQCRDGLGQGAGHTLKNVCPTNHQSITNLRGRGQLNEQKRAKERERRLVGWLVDRSSYAVGSTPLTGVCKTSLQDDVERRGKVGLLLVGW